VKFGNSIAIPSAPGNKVGNEKSEMFWAIPPRAIYWDVPGEVKTSATMGPFAEAPR
jgi:hypothetical protein